MKILIVSLSFAPNGVSDYPGVNRYAIGLVKALTNRGFGVRVVTPMHSSLPEVETWNGVEIVRIKDTKSLFGRKGTVAFANFLSFGINLQRKPRLFDDIRIVQTDIPLPIRGPLLRAIPLAYVIHHTYRIWSGSDLLWAPFAMMAARHAAWAADVVVVPSHAAAREASREYDIPQEKIRAIYHGTDTGFFRPSSTAGSQGGERHPEILYVGLLEKRKGVAELIRAFSQLITVEPGARLVLIGDGPERAMVVQRCASADLGKSVLMRDHLSDSELVQAINRADVFVFPSQQEGFGFAAVEAMACGKPVVAFDTQINREVIGNGGILVPEGDTQALARSIQTLISDPALARNLGSIARGIVSQRFDWGTTAEEYDRVYKRLVTGAHP